MPSKSQVIGTHESQDKGPGYVMMFAVKSDFLSAYEVHTVGNLIHQVPAEDLSRFRTNIVGRIPMLAEFFAK
jgi:hypothetical protein